MKHKKIFVMIAAAIAATIACVTSINASFDPFAKETRALVKRFGSAECGLHAAWNPHTGTPSRIKGCLTPPSAHSPVWIAYGFLRKAKNVYKLGHPDRELHVQEVVRQEDGTTIVRMEHLLFHTPVYGDTLEFNIDNKGVLQSVEGTIHPGLEHALFQRRTHPAVTAAQAVAIAGKSLPQERTLELSAVTKMYYLASRPSIPLVYEVTFYDHRSLAPVYRTLVHAVMGHIIPEP